MVYFDISHNAVTSSISSICSMHSKTLASHPVPQNFVTGASNVRAGFAPVVLASLFEREAVKNHAATYSQLATGRVAGQNSASASLQNSSSFATQPVGEQAWVRPKRESATD